MNDLLTKPDLSAAQKGLFELAEARKIAEAMERCHLDVTEHLQRCDHYEQVLKGIMREFGANQGPKGQTSK